MSGVDFGLDNRIGTEFLTQEERNIGNKKKEIAACAPKVAGMELKVLGDAQNQVKAIKEKYGDEKTGKLLSLLMATDSGFSVSDFSQNDNLFNFFVFLENQGFIPDILEEGALDDPEVKQIILKDTLFGFMNKSKEHDNNISGNHISVINTSEQTVDNAETKKMFEELAKSSTKVKDEVLSGVDQREFELKRLELEAAVKNNPTVKAQGLGQAELETISRAQAVNHFLGTANIPQDKADIVAKFRGDYQNVSAKYGLETVFPRMGKNPFENYSSSLSKDEKTKKQLDNFVQANKDSIKTDGIKDMPVEAKKSILKDQFGETGLSQEQDKEIASIFENKDKQSEEIRKIIGDKKLDELSPEDKESILTASGFYDKFLEQNSVNLQDEMKTVISFTAIDAYGLYIKNNMEKLRITGAMVDKLDFENGRSSFDLKANINSVDINPHFSFKSDGLYANDAVINGGISKSTDRKLADTLTPEAFMKTLSDIDYSKLGNVKNKEELMKRVSELANEKLNSMQQASISADVVNNFVNSLGYKKGISEFFVPSDLLLNMINGGELHKAKNPQEFAFYEIANNTSEISQNPNDFKFVSDPNVKFLLTETARKGKENGVESMALFESLGLIKDGPNNKKVLDLDKMNKITVALRTFKPEYAAQNLEKSLGVNLADLGFKISKSENSDSENLGYYLEKNKA